MFPSNLKQRLFALDHAVGSHSLSILRYQDTDGAPKHSLWHDVDLYAWGQDSRILHVAEGLGVAGPGGILRSFGAEDFSLVAG